PSPPRALVRTNSDALARPRAGGIRASAVSRARRNALQYKWPRTFQQPAAAVLVNEVSARRQLFQQISCRRRGLNRNAPARRYYLHSARKERLQSRHNIARRQRRPVCELHALPQHELPLLRTCIVTPLRRQLRLKSSVVV